MSVFSLHFRTVTAFLMFTAVTSISFADSAMDGFWRGTFSLLRQQVVLTVTSQNGDDYKLVVESPWRPGQHWTADSVTVDGDRLIATVDALGSRIECSLTEDREHLKGDWILNGNPTPITFLKTARKPNLPEPQEPRPDVVAAASGVGFSLPDLEGRIRSLDDKEFVGKVVLIDIWGTWCPPCKNAIPHLIALQKKYAGQDFTVLGIAFEYEIDDAKRTDLIKRFIRELEMNYPVLDGGSMDVEGWRERTGGVDGILGIKNFAGFPTVLILDRDGSLKHVAVGTSLDTIGSLEHHVVEALKN